MNGPQLAYQFAVGGVFFFLTLWLCFRPGGAERENPSDRRSRSTLVAGLAGYFVFTLAWILVASR